jgi:hypothetical protein
LEEQILKNIRELQKNNNLSVSSKLEQEKLILICKQFMRSINNPVLKIRNSGVAHIAIKEGVIKNL